MNFLKRWFTPTVVQKHPLAELAHKYRNFKLKRLKIVFSSDKSISRILSVEKDIRSYKKLLHECIVMMHSDEMIPVHYVGKKPDEIGLRDFFIVDGLALNPEEEFQEFLDLSVSFLELYQTQEAQDPKTFNTQKNLYTVQNTVGNLIYFLDQF